MLYECDIMLFEDLWVVCQNSRISLSCCIVRTLKLVGMKRESPYLTVYVTVKTTVISIYDIPYPVGVDAASISWVSLENSELISIKAIQTIPCGKPHVSALILQYLGYMPL